MPRRVLIPHGAVPWPAGYRVVAGGRAEVGARADDPGEQEDADDGADDDAGDGAACEACCAVWVVVVLGGIVVAVGVGDDGDGGLAGLEGAGWGGEGVEGGEGGCEEDVGEGSHGVG